MITESLRDVYQEDSLACGDPLYLLDEIKQHAEVTKLTQGWLCVRKPDDLHVEFLFCDFVMSDADDKNIRVNAVFEGSGPSGPLREPRHIYWGPNKEGYTFYLPADGVIEALTKLKEYFDFT